jgi:hypothetical protein
MVMRGLLRHTSIAMRMPRPLIFGVAMLMIVGEAQDVVAELQETASASTDVKGNLEVS